MLKLTAMLAAGTFFFGLVLGEVEPLIAGILSLALIVLAAGSGSDEPTTPP